MIRHLAIIATTKFNLFPVKGGILAYSSTYMILNQRNWDYRKYFPVCICFVCSVNSVKQATNKNLSHTVVTIYLPTTNNLKRGHERMDIATGRLITLPNFYPCIMTKSVIKAVEKLAEYQGFKTLNMFYCKKK